MKTSLAVVIPFYNEEANVESVIREISDALAKDSIPCEFIAINNGSRDTTGEILATLATHDPRVTVVTVTNNQGYGWGVAQGIRATTKEWVTVVSGDGQIDPEDILKAYAAMEKTGADIIKPRRVRRGDGAWRALVSFVYNLVMKIVFRLPGWDINAPPKIFKRAIFQKITIESKNSFIDPEILIKAQKLGCTIVEIETFYRTRQGGHGHTGIKTILEFIADISRWSIR